MSDGSDGSRTVGPVDQAPIPLSFAPEPAHRFSLLGVGIGVDGDGESDGHQPASSTEATAFTSRPDIDAAMVEALRLVRVIDPRAPDV
jgi:hypothetical protein